MYCLASPEPYDFRGKVGTVAEHLGFSVDDRLLILNADDFGLCSEVNSAIIELFALRKVTSATLMVPAPRASEAITLLKSHPTIRCGIHLTLTSDDQIGSFMPQAPLGQIRSLVGSKGGFYANRGEFFAHAIAQDAGVEASAQIRNAIQRGVDITHLDSHEGTLQLKEEFAEEFLRLAVKYRVPVRTGSKALLQQIGLSPAWNDRIRGHGIHTPDNLVYIRIEQFGSFEEKLDAVCQLLNELPPGLTELYFHPTLSWRGKGKEPANWQVRLWDYQILKSDEFTRAIAHNGLKLIDFNYLRRITQMG